jgi:hypothetical protein
MKKIRLCVFFAVLTCQSAFSQMENYVWYFGSFSGIDFSTSPATYLTNGMLWNLEGGGTISDGSGNLLFYTDGMTVYNKNHAFMANGTGLNGNYSTTQSGVIVKQPGNTNIYYVFTVDEWGYTDGLEYSIVDMSLAAGLGSVTVKNATLQTPSCEKLSAVRHCNGVDAWIVSHDYGSDNFRTFLLTSAGLSLTPVVSAVGFNASGIPQYTQGQMKVSPNGRKLAIAYAYSYGPGAIELCDFDPATGVVSNPLQLSNGGDAYGCEFSPDGTRLYAGRYMSTQLHQWNLCAGSNAAILNSMFTFTAPTTYPVGSLQRAPDGRIYIARTYASFLSTINNPNALGNACGYVDSSFSLAPNSSHVGLPNFINIYTKPVPPPFTHTIACYTASFTAPPPVITGTPGCSPVPYPVNSLEWIFGDPASGAANTSTLTNPVHVYTSAGSYTAVVILHYNCSVDTVKMPVNIIANGPALTVSGNFSLCAGEMMTYTASGASSYLWSNNATTTTVALTPPITTIYSVTGTGTNTCKTIKVFTVNVATGPTLTVAGNFTICAGEITTFTASGANAYLWSNSTIAPTITLNPGATSPYTVTGTGTNTCKSEKVFTVTVSKCTAIDASTSHELHVWPNPVHDQLNVIASEVYVLTVYNVTGQRLLYITILPGEQHIDLSGLSAGFYTFKFSGAERHVILRFVKEQ